MKQAWVFFVNTLIEIKDFFLIVFSKLKLVKLPILSMPAFALPVTLTIGAIIFAWVILSHQPSKNNQPINVAVIAKPASVVVDQPKVDAPIKTATVNVYKNAQHIKAQIKLPPMVIEDPTQQVIAASKVEVDDHPHTITTVINTETGQSVTYDTKEPLPWLSMDYRGSVGVYGGFKNGGAAVRLQLKQDFFDVKSIRFGANATIDQVVSGNTDYFVGVGASYNW